MIYRYDLRPTRRLAILDVPHPYCAITVAVEPALFDAYAALDTHDLTVRAAVVRQALREALDTQRLPAADEDEEEAAL